jgi:hypothetical protein
MPLLRSLRPRRGDGARPGAAGAPGLRPSECRRGGPAVPRAPQGTGRRRRRVRRRPCCARSGHPRRPGSAPGSGPLACGSCRWTRQRSVSCCRCAQRTDRPTWPGRWMRSGLSPGASRTRRRCTRTCVAPSSATSSRRSTGSTPTSRLWRWPGRRWRCSRTSAPACRALGPGTYDMHSPQVPDTALREHPITRAIALIGIPSGRVQPADLRPVLQPKS